MTISKRVLLVLLMATAPAFGQTIGKLLLPVVPGKFVQGSYGSNWLTSAVATNVSDTPLQLSGFDPCPFDCLPGKLPPHRSMQIFGMYGCSEVPGAYLFVESGREGDLALTLRSQDMSRQSETWGTAIPVVPVSAGFERRFGLTEIPVSSEFRSLLRIYSLSNSTAPSARLRIYSVDVSAMNPSYPPPGSGDVLLYEGQATFVIPKTGGGLEFCPAAAQLSPSSMNELSGQKMVRVEIEPASGSKYWAFVSVTHNETQHVTVIAP